MSNERKSDGYDVGYGKPPQHTKFVRGQIGNPKGRPKGSKNFKTLLQAELMTPLPIVENGKRKKITKQGAVVKQLVNKAAAGDPRTMVALLNEIRHLEAGSGDVARPSEPLSQSDEMVMEGILKRIRASAGASTDPEQPSSATPDSATDNQSNPEKDQC
jgi:Family of unknown function (DUF5681)